MFRSELTLWAMGKKDPNHAAVWPFWNRLSMCAGPTSPRPARSSAWPASSGYQGGGVEDFAIRSQGMGPCMAVDRQEGPAAGKTYTMPRSARGKDRAQEIGFISERSYPKPAATPLE